MNESLPLFEEAADERTHVEVAAAPPLSPGPNRRSEGESHLAAARRLARRMPSLPAHSPEQVAAGQRICRHLIAMLQAGESASVRTQH